MNKTIGATVAVILVLIPKTVVAQPDQTACHDVPSCVVTSTVVIGGILYYIIKNTVTGETKKVPANGISLPAHRNNQGNYESEFFTVNSSTSCHDLAERKTRETLKQWRVKENKPVRGSGGVSKPGHLLQWECTITTEPKN